MLQRFLISFLIFGCSCKTIDKGALKQTNKTSSNEGFRLCYPGVLDQGCQVFFPIVIDKDGLKQNMLALAQLSKWIYSDPEDEELKNLSVDGIFFKNISTQGILIKHPLVQIVIFRGTEKSVHDFFNDFDFRKFDALDHVLHRGFYRGFKEITEVLTPAMDPQKPIWFAGHSLGGALATVAGMYYAKSYPVEGVFTFGGPKVFSTRGPVFDFTQHGILHKRFVYGMDIVPNLPPKAFGFRHYGGPVVFTKDCKIKSSRQNLFEEGVQDWFLQIRNLFLQKPSLLTGEKKTITRSELDLIRLWHPFGLIDHGMDSYLNCVKKFALSGEVP